MSELSTVPAVKDIASVGTFILGCDGTKYLTGTVTIASVAGTLTDLDTGKAVTIAAPSQVTGNIYSMTFTGLTAGHRYRAVWLFSLSSGNVIPAELELRVAF